MIALLLLSACVIDSGAYPRPRDLEDSWEVTRLRLLGVAAEPPEATVGETVRFSALLADPSGVAETTVWLACPTTEATPFGCPVDLFSVDMETATPDELAALGLIGVQPYFEPVYTPSADLLDDADTRQRENGVFVTVQAMALPAGALEGESFDFTEVESGTKLLVVSETSTPNHNPRITGWTIDALPVPDGAIVEVDPGQGYDLGAVLAEDAVEDYVAMLSDGTLVESTEEPYISWYATRGELVDAWTIYPYHQATWVAPDDSGAEGTWYAVVRDRRGGMGWWAQGFRVR